MTTPAIDLRYAWAGKLVAIDAASIQTTWKLSPKMKTEGEEITTSPNSLPVVMHFSEQKRIVQRDTNIARKTPRGVAGINQEGASNATGITPTRVIGG